MIFCFYVAPKTSRAPRRGVYAAKYGKSDGEKEDGQGQDKTICCSGVENVCAAFPVSFFLFRPGFFTSRDTIRHVLAFGYLRTLTHTESTRRRRRSLRRTARLSYASDDGDTTATAAP